MSNNMPAINKTIIYPNENSFATQAWKLKQEINQNKGIFTQQKQFFFNHYTNQTVYAFRTQSNNGFIGFGIVNTNGYVSFLLIAKDYRQNGYGRKLIEWIQSNHDKISLHVRETNTQAIKFYKSVGFIKHKTITNYYRNNDNAHLLVRNK